MPWAMVLRYIVRIAASMLVWRMATARRGAGEAVNPPPRIDRSAAATRLRETASLGWRAFSAAVLLMATAVLVTGGVTLTVLSPRWLGIALLVLAAAALAATIGDLLALRQLLRYRSFRRRAESLRQEVG